MAAESPIRFGLVGANEMIVALRGLPTALRKGAIRKAVSKAARVMVPPLRAAAPKAKRLYGQQAANNPPGTLRKSTGVVVRNYKRSGLMAAAYVGHKWPKGAAAHLVDKGTQQRTTKRGFNRGVMPGQHFFKPAIEPKRNEVQRVMRDTLADAIAAAVAKHASKSIGKIAAKA